MKKLLAVIILSALVVSSFSAAVFSDDRISVNACADDYRCGAYIGDGYDFQVSVSFNAASPFSSFSVPVYWASSPAAGTGPTFTYSFGIYPVGSETAVFATNATANGDSSEGITWTFSEAPAGEYVARFSQISGMGYLALPKATPLYSNLYLSYSGPSFAFSIGFKKTGADSCFLKLPSEEGQKELLEENLIPMGSEAVPLSTGKFGLLLTVPEGKELYALTGLNSPTWNGMNPPSSCDAFAYKWGGDYASTLSSAPLASAQVKDHKDNADLVLVFDNALGEGQYLITFESTGTGLIGFMCGSEKGNVDQVFSAGEPSSYYPGLNIIYALAEKATPEPTEAPTEAPTEPVQVTEAPEVTEAPVETANAPETSNPSGSSSSGGCGGEIFGSSAAVIASFAALILLKKKKSK